MADLLLPFASTTSCRCWSYDDDPGVGGEADGTEGKIGLAAAGVGKEREREGTTTCFRERERC